MAIVQHYGCPTLFVTFTANPELEPGQDATDRPDIVARVFNLKAKQLLKEIKNRLFSRSPARIWTIEYQKRGLPHLHLLVWLEDREQFLQPRIIDQFSLQSCHLRIWILMAHLQTWSSCS